MLGGEARVVTLALLVWPPDRTVTVLDAAWT